MRIILMDGAGPDTEQIHGRNKCFSILNGRIVAEYTIDLFRDLGIGDITCLCNSTDEKFIRSYDAKIDIIKTKDSMLLGENLIFLEELVNSSKEPVLLYFGDTPFTSKEAIKHFLSNADLKKADLYTAFILEQFADYFSDFQEIKPVYFREYSWVHGPMFYINPEKIDLDKSKKIVMNEIAKNRKVYQKGTAETIRVLTNFLIKGVYYAGPYMVPALASTIISKAAENANFHMIQKISSYFLPSFIPEKQAGKLLGCRIKIIPSMYGEMALEIDTQKQHESFNRNFDRIQERVRDEVELYNEFFKNKDRIMELARYSDLSEYRSRKVIELMNGKGKGHPFRKSFGHDQKRFFEMMRLYF